MFNCGKLSIMIRFFVFFVVLFLSFSVKAQMLFDDAKKNNTETRQQVRQPKKSVEPQKTEEQGVTLEELTRKASSSNDDITKLLSDFSGTPDKNDADGQEENADEDEDVFIPEGELHRLNTPTADGSKRGGQAFVEMDEQGRMKKTEKIFLFYDKFKITNYMKDTASCDVRFNVLANMDRKISQLDVKLVWPDITTTLSFSDIAPNTQTYYNYSLIGNGCYGMDIAPNIIVNRCRIKGMTASECASKLIWLSK